MPIDQTYIEPNWKLLPGTILDGGYEMEEILQADERRARFKIRVLGDRTIDASASCFPVSGNDASDQLEAWDLLRRVPHPNLSKPLAAGRRQLEGLEIIYVVLRKADETLNGVLNERALSSDEARDVLLCCSRALEHLNKHGLMHAAIAPEEILAVDDSIQLSAEGVRRVSGEAVPGASTAKYVAPEGVLGNTTGAASIWCLGATIFETLTQTVYVAGSQDQTTQLPFGWILGRCLEAEPSSRCKPEEIPALLRSGPPLLASTPPPAPALPVILPSSEAPPVTGPLEEVTLARPSALAAAVGGDLPAVGASPVNAASIPVQTGADSSSSEATLSRPQVTSASQARTKVFQQAGFDALTAPKGSNSGGSPKASTSAAASAPTSPPPPAFAAAETGSTLPRGPNGGPALYNHSAGAGVSRARLLELASVNNSAPELRRASGAREIEEKRDPERWRLWMYIGAALVVGALLLWSLRSKTLPAKTPVVTAAPSAVSPSTTPPSANPAGSSAANHAWPTRTLEPEKVNSAAPNVAPAKAKLGSADSAISNNAVWRVVVYTFNRKDDAEKRARALNAKHPHLEAQVFTPGKDSGPYLVTVGGRMSREDAARFRLKSLSSGIPRDSYIQNYRP